MMMIDKFWNFLIRSNAQNFVTVYRLMYGPFI